MSCSMKFHSLKHLPKLDTFAPIDCLSRDNRSIRFYLWLVVWNDKYLYRMDICLHGIIEG